MPSRVSVVGMVLALLQTLVLAYGRVAQNGTDYTIWCDGNCDSLRPNVIPGPPGVVLMGGGTDTTQAFQWLISRAGGGDFVVLRAAGTDAYNPWIMSLASNGELNSCTTVLTSTAAAAYDPVVLDRVRGAAVIFFAGGDQHDYVSLWGNTPLSAVIQTAVSVRGVSVGGTSAGCAILGQYIFTANYDSIESPDALANPYDKRVTLGPQFASFATRFLADVQTDMHFVTRQRMGRLVTFLARLQQDRWSRTVLGVGIDEQTALLLDSTTGLATCVSNTVNGTAYVVQTTGAGVPGTCQPNTPLTYVGLAAARLSPGSTFDFGTRTGTGVVSYELSATDGVLSANPYGPDAPVPVAVGESH